MEFGLAVGGGGWVGTRRVFEQMGPDRLQLREGGGCLSLFGLPFLLAGIFVTLLGLGVVPMNNGADVPAWAWSLMVVMGLVFVGAGGALCFGRSWITLDKAQGKVRKQWGLLVPLRSEELSLGDYEAVVLGFKAGDSDSADRYPVLLKAKVERADLELSSATQYGESRHHAAAVARFLGVRLIDASTEHESVIATDRVDATFQERVRTGDEQGGEAVRPLRLQSRVRESANTVEIVLPGPGFQPAGLLGVAVSIGLLMYAAPEMLRFFRRTHTPDAVQFAILGFAVLLFVLLPLRGVIGSIVLAVRGRTVVTSSAEGIVIETQEAWRVTTHRIPATEIHGLDYGTADAALQSASQLAVRRSARAGKAFTPMGLGRDVPSWLSALRRLVKSKGIVVKSRSGLVTFGAGLPDDEVRYLHAVVARTLGGGDGRRW